MPQAMAAANHQPSKGHRAAFAICTAIAALIHLLPVVGVLGVDTLEELYGVTLDDATITILLRHRALLFGLLGALLLASIARPSLRSTALAGGIFSAASFLLIALDSAGYSDALQRVIAADVIALAALVVAALLHWSNRASLRSPVKPSLLG